MISKFYNHLNEHKFWGKSIPEFLSWIELKSNKNWVWLDTETTGLKGSDYEVQLTQIAFIITKYNPKNNNFIEVDTYNKKIKLTNKTISHMESPNSRIKNVLSFNHYGENNTKYYDEKNTLIDLFTSLKKFNNPMLVIQNASFDMTFLNTRNPIVKFDNEILDTKQILQLFYLPLLKKLSETDNKYKELINKIGISDRDNGLISSSLSKIGPALGINMNGYHDALTDCKLMMEMFTKIIDFLKKYQDIDISMYQNERIITLK